MIMRVMTISKIKEIIIYSGLSGPTYDYHSTPGCTAAQHVATQHTGLQHSTPGCNTAHRVATHNRRVDAPIKPAPRSSSDAAAAVVCAPSGRRGWCGPDAPAAKARAPTRRAPSTPAVRPAAEVARRRAGGARKALHAARRGTAHARAVRREHAWRVPDLHGALAHVARGEMVRPLQQHIARAGVGQHRLGEQHRLGKRAYTLHRTPMPMRSCPVADLCL